MFLSVVNPLPQPEVHSTARGASRNTHSPAQIEVTDIFYVTDGQATVVLGGELVGGKMTRPHEYRGEGIRNGQTHEVGPGDVLVIPAGTPHWFETVPNEVSYLVVKVIQE